ncbi:MAG: M28 family peptidase [Paludibacter sp.]|jgi:Zn-dependent M28 family amino/carboxypeptidase|nr:M28 family peptidase [Paludibacter sp.]
MKHFSFLILCSAILFCACGAKNTTNTIIEPLKVNLPAFDADSAYNNVKRQVDFGARVPNTAAHRACAEFLSAKLQSYGAEVIEQRAEVSAFDGTKLKIVNIIAQFAPENKNRILLYSHWDSRPWADQDSDINNHSKPVDGANDGASGVGILLEIARLVSMQNPTIGVDIIFFDAEDFGAPESYTGKEKNSWCLGSQYWAVHPHKAGYKARFGILLDMVGAPGATFYKEQVSQYYASNVVKKVWDAALETGFSQYFRQEQGGTITDDHLYINRIINIPSIDIIHYNPNYGFGEYWHTAHDNMDNIDRNTLFAVGSVLLYVIYNEKTVK